MEMDVPENVGDKIKVYSDQRAAANRRAVAVLIFAPLLLALVRSPDFQFKEPLSLIEGKLDSGYLAAYGHFVILIVASMYWSSLASCTKLHSAVRWDLRKSVVDGDVQRTESYLMRPPFCLSPFEKRPYLAWLSALSPLIIATIFYSVFLWDYFYFHAENRGSQAERFHDLLLGAPDQRGFHGYWYRGTSSHPWINAPEQTWLGILGLFILLFYVVSGFLILRNYHASMNELAKTNRAR
jgi:hypothetical protein